MKENKIVKEERYCETAKFTRSGIMKKQNGCLDPKFDGDINDEGHCSKICLGVSYITTSWQVGDMMRQNGS